MKNGAIATLVILLVLAGLWAAKNLESGSGSLARGVEVDVAGESQAPPARLDRLEPSGPEIARGEAAESARSELEAPPSVDGAASEAGGESDGVPRAWLRVHVRAAETQIGMGSIPIVAVDLGNEEFLGSSMAGGSTATLGLIPLTDAEGRASLEVPAGIDLAIEVRGMPRFPSPRIEVGVLEEGEDREVVVDLTTEYDLRFFGRVVSDVDRSALGEAEGVLLLEVEWTPVEGRFDAHRSTQALEIGPDGLFEVLAPSWKGWAVRVQAPGFAPVVARLTEGHETPDKALELALRPAGTVLAHVSDALGEPVVGVEVALTLPIWRMGGAVGQADGLMGEDLRFAATSDAQGEARVTGLPPGVALSVDVREPDGKERRLPEPVAVEGGEERELFITVGGGTRIEGWVTDPGGEPVSGMTIWLIEDPGYPMGFFQAHQKASAVTESDGQGGFVFEDVAPGTWFLGPAPTRGHQDPADPQAWAPRTLDVEIVEGELTRTVELEVHRGHYIRGRVLDPQGEPVTRAFVQGFLEGTNSMTQGYVNTDGSFALGPLVPGDYRVKALLFQGAYLGSLPVKVPHTAQDVDLHLRAGVALRGQVLDRATGEPTTAIVQAWKIGPSTDGAWNSMEATDGDFEFKSVEAGEWSLIAWTKDGRVAWGAPVAAGPDPHTLTLDPAVEVRVHFKGTSGVAYVGATRGDARLAHIALSPGEEHTLNLPEGKTTLGWQIIDNAPGSDPAGIIDQHEYDLRAGRGVELVLP